MAGYIITTILLIIVLSIQGSKQNFGLWKLIIIGSLVFIITYDISNLLSINLKEYMFSIWVGTIIISCLGMLILLIGEEKSIISLSQNENIEM